jgi:predicted regulator of Ras-like GTPase activity (Roadblock/LC7/MglB family)
MEKGGQAFRGKRVRRLPRVRSDVEIDSHEAGEVFCEPRATDGGARFLDAACVAGSRSNDTMAEDAASPCRPCQFGSSSAEACRRRGATTGLLDPIEGGSIGSGSMFKEALRQIVDSTEGAIAGLHMGFDGIAVESYTRDGQDTGKDINEIGMEYSVILGSIKRAAEALEAGGAREVAIQAEHLTTIIRVINDEYFLALTMRPDGNPGKGRFVLRTAAPRLLSELS